MKKVIPPIVFCSVFGVAWGVALNCWFGEPFKPKAREAAVEQSVCWCGTGCSCEGGTWQEPCDNGNCGGYGNMIGREKGEDGRPCKCGDQYGPSPKRCTRARPTRTTYTTTGSRLRSLRSPSRKDGDP